MKIPNINSSDRQTFSRIADIIQSPDLLNVQVDSWESFLQAQVSPSKRKKIGLQEVFLANFPVVDVRESITLEFLEYYVDKPRYSIEECQERGLSYTFQLKAKLRLVPMTDEAKDVVDAIEQEVYLGSIPAMTHRGTFVINGVERVVVSQLHRSPGVFFSESTHPNGIQIYSARIIPFRGAWVEFTTDINNLMFVYIDRKKKFLVTTLLRALGFSSDDDILRLFDLVEEIDLRKVNIKDYVGRVVCSDVIDKKTGEILLSKDAQLTDEIIPDIEKSSLKVISFFREDAAQASIITNTIHIIKSNV